MTMRYLPFLIALLTCAACVQDDQPEAWAHLPEPVTNNAVAGVELDGHLMAYSFAGLHAGKTWRDVTADAYACDLDARTCREIAGLPDGIGRLASVAVSVDGQIYIFGGYTVAEDGSEASTPEVWRFDPATETYTRITDMPVPVDDTIALPFEDRYIYLVSGWHDTDNTDLVQVYDVEDDRWFQATPFPGAPVFGHAGAMGATGQILVCGGTAVIPPVEAGGRRSFEATDACWVGFVSDDPSDIIWHAADPVPGGPFYRGVMVVREPLFTNGAILLAGSGNAYNYDGIGYDGAPVAPRGDRVLAFPDLVDPCVPSEVTLHWETGPASVGRLGIMDVRGTAGEFILGGMTADQSVSDAVIRWTHADLDIFRIRHGGCGFR
ncbi:kelch repeat-containing protein [uncultured Maricaulis sp.]|uniref:Kelch repeat-containing protein n=1 Tax=uncultured Maricaulis sp. TaxID=174710 RepID=UPI0030D9C754|tara:strand:+ start:26493 stop:27629 length:1137 start_codon:yes stop_codon:yes gene_type:complete